ncbi:hypothetical protein DFJ74DRAFT_773301 [Hyaloraphidium curvatum]|nr:hypothetical protein DFJ74DRAFT_773301 [Hyaloraphidium curvatum]
MDTPYISQPPKDPPPPPPRVNWRSVGNAAANAVCWAGEENYWQVEARMIRDPDCSPEARHAVRAVYSGFFQLAQLGLGDRGFEIAEGGLDSLEVHAGDFRERELALREHALDRRHCGFKLGRVRKRRIDLGHLGSRGADLGGRERHVDLANDLLDNGIQRRRIGELQNKRSSTNVERASEPGFKWGPVLGKGGVPVQNKFMAMYQLQRRAGTAYMMELDGIVSWNEPLCMGALGNKEVAFANTPVTVKHLSYVENMETLYYGERMFGMELTDADRGLFLKLWFSKAPTQHPLHPNKESSYNRRATGIFVDDASNTDFSVDSSKNIMVVSDVTQPAIAPPLDFGAEQGGFVGKRVHRNLGLGSLLPHDHLGVLELLDEIPEVGKAQYLDRIALRGRDLRDGSSGSEADEDAAVKSVASSEADDDSGCEIPKQAKSLSHVPETINSTNKTANRGNLHRPSLPNKAKAYKVLKTARASVELSSDSDADSLKDFIVGDDVSLGEASSDSSNEVVSFKSKMESDSEPDANVIVKIKSEPLHAVPKYSGSPRKHLASDDDGDHPEAALLPKKVKITSGSRSAQDTPRTKLANSITALAMTSPQGPTGFLPSHANPNHKTPIPNKKSSLKTPSKNSKQQRP